MAKKKPGRGRPSFVKERQHVGLRQEALEAREWLEHHWDSNPTEAVNRALEETAKREGMR